MNKCYTLIGLPGSGKSTWAAQHKDCVIICPDSIRAEFYGHESIQGDGQKIFEIAFSRINAALANGQDVIFDATNTQRKYRKSIFKNVPDAYHVAILFDVSIDTCKQRNAARARKVPETVIDRMARKLVRPSLDEGFKEIKIIR